MSQGEIVVQRRPGNRRTKNEKRAEAMEVLRLKVLGTRDVEIAEALHMSLATVKRRLSDFIAEHGEQSVREYREVSKQQLEVLLAACMPGVAQNDVLAINTALRIVDRMIKLQGTDAPVQVDVTVTEVTQQERELADMIAQAKRDQQMRKADLINSRKG